MNIQSSLQLSSAVSGSMTAGGGRGTTDISTEILGYGAGRAPDDDSHFDLGLKTIFEIDINSIFKFIFFKILMNFFGSIRFMFLTMI